MPGPMGGLLWGRCLVQGGAWSQGLLGGGGAWFLGSAPGGIPACTEADSPPPSGETATAADGTHPIGMHSCSHFFVYAKKIGSVGVSLESFLNECKC